MGTFALNVFIPLLVAFIIIILTYSICRMILDIFGLGFTPLVILLFLAVYYFLGEFMLSIMTQYVIKNLYNYVEWVYIPIQKFIRLFFIV